MKSVLRAILATFLIVFFTGCTVTESIIFNDDMSGEYSLGYDLSAMMKISDEMNSDTQEARNYKKLDTTIVFNDLFEEKKDSIAALPKEEQLEFEKLRDMTLVIHEDEENGEFSMVISKPFKNVGDLENITEQVDRALESAMREDEDKKMALNNDMTNMNTELDKVFYSFEGNTFVRHQPKAKKDEEAAALNEEEEGLEETMNDEISKMTKESFYIITYSFPKKIKSISNKNAQIARDGKSFTLSIPWDDIDKDETLLNLKIELEKK